MTYFRFQGATLTVLDGTYKAVGGFLGMNHASGSAADIDRTNAASTRKINKQGLADFGTFQVDLQRDPGDVGQAVLDARKADGASTTFKFTIPGATAQVMTFVGFVKSLSLEADTAGDLKGKCNIRITGTPVWTP